MIRIVTPLNYAKEMKMNIDINATARCALCGKSLNIEHEESGYTDTDITLYVSSCMDCMLNKKWKLTKDSEYPRLHEYIAMIMYDDSMRHGELIESGDHLVWKDMSKQTYLDDCVVAWAYEE